ncbi:MAG: hypothetical protein JZD41_02775 [Thermoproteus sp.]|nr:hypothetical protein [Thermoproteus sp.]
MIVEMEEAELDLEDVVLDVLMERLKQNPNEVAAYRISLAERLLEEAEEHIGRRDVVQASEGHIRRSTSTPAGGNGAGRA